MRGGRLSEALALLDVDDADHADAPALLRLQLEVLERLGDWQRIAALLPEARRYGLRAETALAALEERSWLARLEHAGASSGCGGGPLASMVRGKSRSNAQNGRSIQCEPRSDMVPFAKSHHRYHLGPGK